MRNALTYGALGGGALLAGGQAIREQEDPGSIFLAGLGGGAGAIGGFVGAKLADAGAEVSMVAVSYTHLTLPTSDLV